MARSEAQAIPWWGALGMLLLAGAGTLGVLAFSAAVKVAGRGWPWADAWQSFGGDPFALSLAQGAGVGLALLVGLRRFGGGRPPRQALRLRPISGLVVALCVLAGVALQFPLSELGNLTQEIIPLSLEQRLAQQRLLSPDGFRESLLVILAVVVIAPLSEELLFRGLLLPGLDQLYGTGFAVFFSALLFGASHMSPVALPYATAAGLILAMVALRLASTWASVVVHAAVNATPLLLAPSIVMIPGFNTVGERVQHISPLLLVAASLVAALALSALVRLRDTEET